MLTELAADEGEHLQDVAERLNRHGFEIQHTLDELGPKVARWARILQQPLVAASLPWLLRRLLGRPLRKRG
jgi:hypothetical protein